MLAAIVLYEDSPTERGFEFHKLAVRCLHDDLASKWQADAEGSAGPPAFFALLGRFKGWTMGGCNNVLKRCQTQFESLRASAPAIITVYDDDKLRPMLNKALHLSPPLAPGCTCEAYGEALRRGCPEPTALHVVRLEQNIESVLGAIQKLDLLPERTDDLARAIRRKDLNSRDIVFGDLARERLRAERVRLRKEMPSFDRLARALGRAFKAADASEP
ncbi:MAG: hypothetical protein U0326_17690 [Polyangiales bacterium]